LVPGSLSVRYILSLYVSMAPLTEEGGVFFVDNRMEKKTFGRLVVLLSRNGDDLTDAEGCNEHLFRPKGAERLQAPVEVQLAMFLSYVRTGTRVHAAATTSVGEGSVYNYVYCISAALIRLSEHYVKWPWAEPEVEATGRTFLFWYRLGRAWERLMGCLWS
jgi:hypothetical protein